jgi:2-polyprenyl-3-methyl-5-hydroxy-6-metoxy-1,4-benzoquinol methylase
VKVTNINDLLLQYEKELLEQNAANTWFVTDYWPSNLPRLRQFLELLYQHLPPVDAGKQTVRVLDVGCGSGYMSVLFSRSGYAVTGVDNYDDPYRNDRFSSEGLTYKEANFNNAHPLACCADKSFDGVVCGEVLEHILNHPQGFVDDLFRVTRPGGYLVLSTPNPSTLMNAIRVLTGQYKLWGTEDFVQQTKFHEGKPISFPDIHYREYLKEDLTTMITRAGYTMVQHSFIGPGPTRQDSLPKTLLKRSFLWNKIQQTRLLGSGHLLIAQRPARQPQAAEPAT